MYANGHIAELPSVGRNFRSVNLFNAVMSEGDIQKFLSLFFSYVQNIALQYEQLRVSFSDEHITTSPVLISEKIDADDALFMRVAQVLPGIDAALLSDYDLQYFAGVNELENIIDPELHLAIKKFPLVAPLLSYLSIINMQALLCTVSVFSFYIFY